MMQPGSAGRGDVFFAAVGMTRMPMVVTDPQQPDNPIVFANHAFMEMTGFGPDELLGRNCRFLQGPETDPETIAALRVAVRDRASIAVEMLNHRRDGTPFWIALFISPVFGPQGELLYFLGSQFDITRRRDAETALLQAQKLEAVGQLSGGIAHDFNNLLTVIAGNLELLETAETPQRRQRLSLRMREAVTRAQRLTQQLLAFARKQPLDRQVVDLNTLVEGLCKPIQRLLGPGIRLETRLDPGLGPCRADPARTEAALLNLLLNARDAMPEGGRVTIGTAAAALGPKAPEVTVDGLAPGGYVALTVTDTGRGMPPAVLNRATEPFFTTKETGQGSGLGLSTVHGFARQSRGHLLLRSRPGHGTTARLLFPAATSAERPPQGGETVLLADGSPVMLEVAAEWLGTLGYQVLTAASGQEALMVLESGAAVDLLLADLAMPGGMDGVTLAQEVRQRWPGLRILLAAGQAGAPGRGEPGADLAVIARPYRRGDLARRIRQVLDRPEAT